MDDSTLDKLSAISTELLAYLKWPLDSQISLRALPRRQVNTKGGAAPEFAIKIDETA